MNDVIDQRTVEMRFDNRDFEKNIQTSLNTIDLFNRSLNFKDSSRGLEELSRSFKNFDLGNMKKQADSAADSFSNLFKTIGKITLAKDTFDKLKGVAKSTFESMFQVRQMQAGWDKYTMKVESVQTIMNATQRSIDDVSAALDKLNWYTDETSYDFADMVNNIGKFTSSGVKLEDAVTAMQGISNWAATSGRDVGEARRAMYNLSQAIAVGAVKMMDWRSIQNANMDTVEFKQTVLDTGVAIGKLQKQGNDYYSKIGKKQKLTVENFASTLSTGWFDKDLLVATLKRYSEFTDKVYEFMENNPDEEFDSVQKAMERMREEAKDAGEEFDELGYKWFLSAQQAKTFKDVVNATKDAVSTGWMKTFELFIGDYEHARELWSSVVEDFWEVFAKPGETRNNFLTEVLTTNYGKLKKEIKKAGLSVEEFEERIKSSVETNETNKKMLDELISEYGSLSRAIEVGEVPTDIIRKAFVQLSQSGEEVEKTIPTLEEVQQIINDTWGGKYGNGTERFDAYRALGYDPEKLQKLVTVYSKKGKIELKDLEEAGIEVGQTYSKTWKEFIEGNGELIESLDELSGRDLVIESIRNTLGSAFKGFTSVREGLESVFEISPEKVTGFLQNVYKVTDSFKLTEENAEKLKNFTVALFQPLKSVGTVAQKFMGAFLGDSFKDALPKIKNFFGETFDGVYTFQRRVSKVFKSLENSAYVNKAINKISELTGSFTEGFSSGIEKYGSMAVGYFKKTFVGSAIEKYVTQWKSIWSELNTGGQNAFDTLIKTGKEFKSRWDSSHGEDWNLFSSLWDGIKRDFGKFKGSKLFEDITSSFDDLFQKIFKPKDKQKEKDPNDIAGGFIKNVNDGFEVLKDKFKDTWFGGKLETIQSGWQKAVSTFKKIFGKDTEEFSDTINKGIKGALEGGTKRKRVSKTDSESFYNKILGPIVSDSAFGKFLANVKEKFSKVSEVISSIFKKDEKRGVKGAAGSQSIFSSIFGSMNLETLTANLEKIKSTFQNFWDKTKPFLKMMGEGFAKSFNLPNLTSFLAALSGFKITKFLGSFKQVADSYKFSNISSTLKRDIEGLIDAFSPLKDTKRELKARTILEFTAAIALIAGSLYMISKLSDADLKRSGIVIGAIAVALAGIALFLSHLGNAQFTIAFAGTGQVLKLIGLILAISIALKNVGKAAQGISNAVDTLVGAVDKFSDLAAKKVKFQEGVQAVQDLILALGVAAGIAGLGLGNLLGGSALTILSLAGSIRILYGAIVDLTALASVSPKEMEQAIDSIGELIMALGRSAMRAGLTNGSWKDAGAAETILALSGAIRILQNAVLTFAAIPVKRLESAAEAISNLLNAIGKASFWSGFLTNGMAGFGRAATIFAFGKSIEMLIGSVESIIKLSSIDEKRFDKAVGVVKMIMNTLTGMSVVLGIARRFGAGVTISQAMGIVAFGAAIRLIGETIENLGKLNRERLIQGGNAVGMIGTMLAGFTVVLGIVNRFLGLSIKGIGSAAMIVSFGMAISNIADTVIKLGDLNPIKMNKGIRAVWHIVGIVSLLTLVSSISNRISSGSKFNSVNFIAIATGIYVLGQAIEKLGEMEPGILKRGTESVAVLAGAIAACIAIMNIGAKVPSWTNAVNIIALAGSVYVLSEAAKTFANLDGNQIKKAAGGVTALLVGLTALSKWGLASGDIGTLLNSVGLLVIAGAVSLLAEVAKSFADMEWDQMAKIGTAFAALIGGMWAISKFVKIGAKISLGSVVKLGGIILVLGGVLAALGAVFNVLNLSPAMDAGIEFISKIGKAIGKFFGAIVGGFDEGVAQAMPAVGSAMASFAENARPFFQIIDEFKDVDPMSALSAFADALSKVTWNEIATKIFNLFPDKDAEAKFKSIEAFGNGLKEFGPGFREFLESFEDKDTSKLTEVATSLKDLSEISKDQQWIKQNPIASDNPLINFATAINDAAEKLGEAITKLNDLPSLTDNARKAIDSLKTFSEVDTGTSTEIDFHAGAFGFLLSFKENSYSEFAADLEGSIDNFKEFVSRANDIPYVMFGNKNKVEVLADVLTKMANVEPPASGGLITFLSDHSQAFTKFAADLSGGIGNFRTFLSGVKEADMPDMTTANNFIDILNRLANITRVVNPDYNGSEGFYLTFGELIDEYHGAVDQVDILAERIAKSQENMDLINNLASIFNPDKDVDLTRLNALPDAIKTFVDDLNKKMEGITIDEALSKGISGIAELLSPIEDIPEFGFTEVAQDISSGISTLSSINQDNGNNDLIAAEGTINAFVRFVRQIKRIQDNFNNTKFNENIGKVIESLNKNFENIKPMALINMNTIRNLFDALKELHNLDIKRQDTKGTTILEDAFRALADAINAFAPTAEKSELEEWVSWIESLADKTDTFKKAGEAINAFSLDTNQLDSLTKFMESIKDYPYFQNNKKVKISDYDPENPNPFSAWNWGGIAPEMENFGKGDIEELYSGYFTDVAQDLVSMSNYLKKNVDFTEFDNLAVKLNTLSAAIQRLISSNGVSEKMKELVKGINDAILGDGTNKNPGIQDYGDRLDQLNSLTPIFENLESYQTLGLKDVIPTILSSISDSINNFSYDPAGIELLNKAVTEIKKALDILNGDAGIELPKKSPKLGFSGALEKESKKRIRPDSKVDDLLEKLSYDQDIRRRPDSKIDDLIEKIKRKREKDLDFDFNLPKVKNGDIFQYIETAEQISDMFSEISDMQKADENYAKHISDATDSSLYWLEHYQKEYDRALKSYDDYVKNNPEATDHKDFNFLENFFGLSDSDPRKDIFELEKNLKATEEKLNKYKQEYEKNKELDVQFNPEKYVPKIEEIESPIEETEKSVFEKAEEIKTKIGEIYEILEKSQSLEFSEDNIFTSFANAINDLNIDTGKADIITNISESLLDIAEGTAKPDPESIVQFVSAISDSIINNRGITTNAGKVLVEDILTALNEFIQKFFEVGMFYVRAIADGLEANSGEAVEMAATVATRILSKFGEVAISSGGEKGRQMISSIVEGLMSEESKSAINSAINSLFEDNSENSLQNNSSGTISQDETTIGSSSGQISGSGPGYRFAQKFVDDFRDGMKTGVLNMVDEIRVSLEETSDAVNFTDLSNNIVEQAEEANKEIEAPLTILHDNLSNCVPDGSGLANAMIDGIINALKARVEEACAEIAAFASAMAEAARGALAINSPSKVFYSIGESVIEGFVKGVRENENVAKNSITGMCDLTSSEAEKLIDIIEKYGGSIFYKGKKFSYKDIPYLRSLISGFSTANNEISSFGQTYNDTERKLSGGGGGGGGGFGGVKKATEANEELSKSYGGVKSAVENIADFFKDPKKNFNIKGLVLTAQDIGKIFEEYDKFGGDYVKYFGQKFYREDLEEFLKEFDEIPKYIQDIVDDHELTITPVIDDKGIKGFFEGESTSSKMAANINSTQSAINKGVENMLGKIKESKEGSTYNFVQNNYSPKALSRADIYRDTKNQFSMLKGEA